jgi:hypothetical protein
MRKAVLKKNLGKLKEGTVLHYLNGVFAHEGHTFMPEDVYFDEVHFELVEGATTEYVSNVEENIFDIFVEPRLAQVFTD